MKRIVIITFTPKDWSGGVNRWVCDFMSGMHNAVHFSANYIPEWKYGLCHEWDAAKTLNAYLRQSKKISKDDIIIVDGFWGLGLEDFPNVISVSHGIWSHQTKEDVEIGKLPDFPIHHAIQLDYRKKHIASGGKIVAVSDFIATELRRQWGLPSHVINNAVDLDVFKPFNNLHIKKHNKLIIHGINDSGNENKGWKHIEYLKKHLNEDIDIMSLDEAHNIMKMSSKAETLACADLVIIPSAYEGNSYFCLEALACNVPIVAYNVGLMYKAWGDKNCLDVGILLDRQKRCEEYTYFNVVKFLREPHDVAPRRWVSQYSLQNFHKEWNDYLRINFND